MQRDERTDWQPIHLEGGTKAYLEVIPRGGREEVGLLEAIPFDRVVETLGQIANGVAPRLRRPNRARPSSRSVSNSD
jgi:hypothetical protein